MATTQGSARGTSTAGPRVGCSGRRLAVGLAGLALGVSAVAACSGGSPAPVAGNATVTVTSTPSTPSAPSTPLAPSTPSSGGPATTSGSPGGAEVPAAPVAGGQARCAPGQMRVTVMGAPGGGSAGHQEMQIIATNTGPTQCTIQGYPGVSLTAAGSGAQLGAAADRVAGDAPLIRLQPGRTAVSSLLVTQPGAYGSSCGQTNAAGFRIYLPGQTAAIFAPKPTPACRATSVHQLSVKPFTS